MFPQSFRLVLRFQHPPLFVGHRLHFNARAIEIVYSRRTFHGCAKRLKRRGQGCGDKSSLLERQAVFPREVFLQLVLLVSIAGAQQIAITGVVQDATGAAIPGAQITLRFSGSTQTVYTTEQGKFSFTAPIGASGSITVVAGRFAPAEQNWPRGLPQESLNSPSSFCAVSGPKAIALWCPQPGAS